MQTEAVKEIQHYLRTLSFREPRIRTIEVDGKYGANTAAAVASFQDIIGIPVNGVTDPVTWDRLVAEYRRNQSPVEPLFVVEDNTSLIDSSSPTDKVAILQAMLWHLSGRYRNLAVPTINGVFDTQTQNSVLQFKRLQGLPSVSTVDAATWNLLASLYNNRATSVPYSKE